MPDISAKQLDKIITNYQNRDFRPESSEGRIFGAPGDKMKRLDNLCPNSVIHDIIGKKEIGMHQIASNFFSVEFE
jgi:hypothetical protein